MEKYLKPWTLQLIVNSVEIYDWIFWPFFTCIVSARQWSRWNGSSVLLKEKSAQMILEPVSYQGTYRGS